MSEPECIYKFEKNSAEEVRVSLTTYNGKDYIDIRVFYLADDGEMRPTKKGLTVSVVLLPELSTAVEKLHEALGPGGEKGGKR